MPLVDVSIVEETLQEHVFLSSVRRQDTSQSFLFNQSSTGLQPGDVSYFFDVFGKGEEKSWIANQYDLN